MAGLSGEQFALPETIGQLRAVRRSDPTGELIGISAADPLNLAGIVTPGERIPALARNRVVYRDGIPVAALEKGAVRCCRPDDILFHPPSRGYCLAVLAYGCSWR